MILSIASGKGGTGKTTVACNMAASLDDPVQLLDCDVEEPNAHLFMKPKISGTETVSVFVPEVDLETCEFCGACGEICQFSAITSVGEVVLTFPEMCHGCRGCLMVCPSGAIRESSRELGVIEKGDAGNVIFTGGRLRVGEAMSPPLIREVQKRIQADIPAIIDAPPGTSCPVIAAIRNTDYVILVTEPTPFGLNDLKLAVGAVRTLGIPFGIILNRSDAGNDETLKYVREEGIPVLLEIPDRREIAEAYSKGVLMIDIMPEMKTAFRSVFDRISAEVQAAKEKHGS